MQILFAISVLCFLAIAWAAISFARHIKASYIRAGERKQVSNAVGSSGIGSSAPGQPDFRQHLFLAAEAEMPRVRHSDLHQNVRDITANKSWNMPLKASHSLRRMEPATSPGEQVESRRKPPQPARHGTMALLDPAYFNKDSGDLTDPFQPPRLRVNSNHAVPPKRY